MPWAPSTDLPSLPSVPPSHPAGSESLFFKKIQKMQFLSKACLFHCLHLWELQLRFYLARWMQYCYDASHNISRSQSPLQFGDLQKFRDVDKIVIEINLLECSTCKSNISESYAFTCLYCDFNLHLHCGPLPYTIKHKDHIIHPLFLTNSPLQEEVEDETDEFYCHACEEERDPLLPVYYCAECQFVAEFKCVFSQVRWYTIILFLKIWKFKS